MADNDEETGFTWENAYERTWEALREDESGSVRSSVVDIVNAAKRQRLANRATHVKLGIMRHLYLIVDMSEAMLAKDLVPTRQIVTCQLLTTFVTEFFDQNPISQLGIIITRDKRAEKLLELTGNARRHAEALERLNDMACAGEPSLQNALEMAERTLQNLPSHSSREVLIIMGSVHLCDPGDINTTIAMCARQRIRASVISLAAQVHVMKRLAQETYGTCSVIMDESHFKDLLFAVTLPPAATSAADFNLVRMGFPIHRRTHAMDSPSMCVCHMPTAAELKDCRREYTKAGYFCPQCDAKYCSLPVECRICKLTLVSAPQLARSYQHLAPLKPFVEHTLKDNAVTPCNGCGNRCDRSTYRCSKCAKDYCIDCDILLHESLHTCPTC